MHGDVTVVKSLLLHLLVLLRVVALHCCGGETLTQLEGMLGRAGLFATKPAGSRPAHTIRRVSRSLQDYGTVGQRGEHAVASGCIAETECIERDHSIR